MQDTRREPCNGSEIAEQVPDSIQPGMHEVMVIIDEVEARSSRAVRGGLMRFAGAIPSLVDVEGVAAQRAMREEWQ